MKLAIVGSRNFNNYELLCSFIEDKFNLNDIDTIVSGGAKGADALAERFAKDHNLVLSVKKADWSRYGKAAGPMRNRLIVSEADAVVAFPSPTSKGTLNSMDLARKMCKRLEVLYVQDDPQ